MAEDTRLTPLAATLPSAVPFVGPEAQERAMGRPFTARIGANESLFGPAPKAIAAMAAAASDVWMYADPEAHDLKAALAARHGCAPENIVVGAGIDGLLGVTARLFLAEGDAAVTSHGSYPTFDFHVAGFGARNLKVPYKDDREDPEALLAQAGAAGAKLIYLANPDNPMGSWHAAATIEAMVARVPGGALLALDEAYVDFAPQGAVPQIDPEDRHVLRYRTFSKAWGMAGARIGYVIGPRDLIAAFDKVRDHFGLSRISVTGALASLGDPGWLAHVRAEVAAARTRISEIARANGLRPLPSATNFVTVDCGATGAFARAVLAALGRRGIFVRMPFAPPGDRCIRISCGPAPAMAAFAEALPAALAEAREAV